MSPEEIGAKFILQTPEDPEQNQIIDPYDPASIERSHFSTTRITWIVIHGVGDVATNNWVYEVCKLKVKAGNLNCIGIDWRKGAGDIPTYYQSVSNARVLGAQIAYFMNVTQTLNSSYTPDNFCLLGHSLGAQVSGEAGKRVSKLGCIIGLDPAGPYFDGTSTEVHLDKSDANDVQVIHTNQGILGLGSKEQTGLCDFYPNGGIFMPGCPDLTTISPDLSGIINGVRQFLGCNHYRAVEFFIASLNNPSGFMGYACDDYDSFQKVFYFGVEGGVGADDKFKPWYIPTVGATSLTVTAAGFFTRNYARSAHVENNQAPCEVLGGFLHFTWCLVSHAGAWRDVIEGGVIEGAVLEQPDLSWRELRRGYSAWKYSISVTPNVNASVSMSISLYSEEGDIKDHQITPSSGNTYSSFLDSEFEMKKINKVTVKWFPGPLLSVAPKLLGAEKVVVQTGSDGSIWKFCGQGTVQPNVEQTLSPC
ncbi:pancreatic lipase-related protein 2-like [Pelodytes ibericus]